MAVITATELLKSMTNATEGMTPIINTAIIQANSYIFIKTGVDDTIYATFNDNKKQAYEVLKSQLAMVIMNQFDKLGIKEESDGEVRTVYSLVVPDSIYSQIAYFITPDKAASRFSL